MRVTAARQVQAAWLRVLTPERIRLYPRITTLVVMLVGVYGAVFGLGSNGASQHVLSGDFRSFYTGGYLVAHGLSESLVDPEAQRVLEQKLFGSGIDGVAVWVSPPYFAWLFAPFSRLPYLLALLAFVSLSLVCLYFALRSLSRELALDRSAPELMLIGIQYYPALNWLLNGQITGLWLSVFVSAFVLLRRGRDFQAGLVLGSLACKPTLALGVGVLLLSARRARALSGAALSGLGLVGLGFLTLPHAMRAYLHTGSALVAFVRGQGYNTAGLHGSFEFATLLLDGLSPRLASLVGWGLVLGLALWIARLWWREPWQPATCSWDLRFAASLALGVIASPHVFVYDLMLLLLPLFIAAGQLRGGQLPLDGGRVLGLTAVVWALGLMGPALTVGQQDLTRALFGTSLALQIGVIAVVAWGLVLAREAQREPGLSGSPEPPSGC